MPTCFSNLEMVYLRLGLKPSQNPAWDQNPHGWDSNPAKIHSTWFQDLMKLRFLMSNHRKNSVRDKVIGKKWIYSDTERSTFHRVWTITESECGPEIWHAQFLQGGQLHTLMSGRIIPTIFGKGQRFPGYGPLPTPWSFNSALELSGHLWACHFTC